MCLVFCRSNEVVWEIPVNLCILTHRISEHGDHAKRQMREQNIEMAPRCVSMYAPIFNLPARIEDDWEDSAGRPI